jgi:hypothetical protein
MIILNFSHPLTSEQLLQIGALVGREAQAVHHIRTQLDVSTPLAPQITQLVDDLGISPEAWQQQAWLIVLPSLNYAAGVLLAELHGRMGHFPAVLRLRSKVGALVTEFEVAEIINLESVRQSARTRR